MSQARESETIAAKAMHTLFREGQGNPMSAKLEQKNRTRDDKGRFAPGNKLSPGRPRKELCIPEILRRIGDEKTASGMPKIEVVCRTVYKFAVTGESWAVNFIADRTEGKPLQMILTDGNSHADMTNDELAREIRSLENTLGIAHGGKRKKATRKGKSKPA